MKKARVHIYLYLYLFHVDFQIFKVMKTELTFRIINNRQLMITLCP